MHLAYACVVTRRRLDAAGLRLVRAIESEGSVTGAARLLGLTQPAASQQLRALDRLLGTPVVVRHGRTVRLTDAGAVLARHARGVDQALDAAVEEVAAVASLRAGRVRLTAFPSAAATVMPRALAALRAAHPGLTISFTEAEPPQALALLDAGRCDVAVTFRPADSIGDPARVAVGLLEDELVAVVAQERTQVHEPIELSSLAEETWIAGCPQCRTTLLDSCRGAGFDPQIDFATDDYVTVLALVATGLGIATLPGLALLATHPPGTRVVRTVRPATRLVEAVTTPALARVPAVRAAVDALAVAAQEITTGPLVRPPARRPPIGRP